MQRFTLYAWPLKNIRLGDLIWTFILFFMNKLEITPVPVNFVLTVDRVWAWKVSLMLQ